MFFKKAQFTLFVILGIVLVIIASLAIYLVMSTDRDAQFTPTLTDGYSALNSDRWDEPLQELTEAEIVELVELLKEEILDEMSEQIDFLGVPINSLELEGVEFTSTQFGPAQIVQKQPNGIISPSLREFEEALEEKWCSHLEEIYSQEPHFELTLNRCEVSIDEFQINLQADTLVFIEPLNLFVEDFFEDFFESDLGFLINARDELYEHYLLNNNYFKSFEDTNIVIDLQGEYNVIELIRESSLRFAHE